MLDIMQDQELVTRAQNQDVTAFGEIYEAYHSKVFSFLMNQTGQRELAEDLASDTFVRCIEKIHSYTGKARLANWLIQIAHNMAKDVGKTSEYRLTTPTEFSDDNAFVPVDNGQTPEVYAIANDTKAQIQNALDRLPERTARIMSLFLVEELPYKEISAIVGVSVARCKSIVSENRKKLRANLQHVWTEYQACE